MTNNDVLRRLRYAVNISNKEMIEIFKLSGQEMDQGIIASLLKKEDEEGYLDCGDLVLESFLDGLIAYKRGARAGGNPAEHIPSDQLTNNDIMKKIRIALELKEGDMLEVFKLAQFPTSKSELSALFRSKDHQNYKECGDQMLRNFLKGLTIRNRDAQGAKKEPAPQK